MSKQSYQNYIRFYFPHHFIFYPFLLALLSISVYFTFTKNETLIWAFISTIIVTIILLGFMLRQHYALVLQDRIIRLEVRYRYFSLTGKRLEEFESELNDSQLFALRFAPDDELIALVDSVRKDNISGKTIKKSIVHWKADNHRV